MHRESRRGRRRHRQGGWGARGRFFRPGEVRLALLALLAEGPKHGYELMRELEERSEGSYRASAGTVYPTLQQLEDEGLARSEERDGKRVYQLTSEGEREVEETRDSVDDIWSRAREWGDWTFVRDPDAAEIMRPVLRLAREAYRAVARSHADPDLVERVREVLQRAREEIKDLSHRARRR